MARREYVLRKSCAHAGCAEMSRYTYSTRRDLENSYEARNEFRCIRHSRPGEVLSVDNLNTEVMMISKQVEGCPNHFSWSGNGFQHGPGFKAWADDFPEGTKLIVTARIVIPD